MRLYNGRNRQAEAFFKLCFGEHGRVVVRTKQGYIGLAPETTRMGDSIVLCKGGKLPFVMRMNEENQMIVGDSGKLSFVLWKKVEHWVILGDCYVHGIMNGEAFDAKKCSTMWIK
jgi:hypothetical protein